MSILYDNQNEEQAALLEADGKVVRVRGCSYRIRAKLHRAAYPYEHVALSVTAEMTDKQTPEYRSVRRVLGGEWVTDVLALEDLDLASEFAIAIQGVVCGLGVSHG